MLPYILRKKVLKQEVLNRQSITETFVFQHFNGVGRERQISEGGSGN